MSKNDEIVSHLAKELWAAFEYGLPVSPSAMANYIVKQIEIAGYEIVKVGAMSEIKICEYCKQRATVYAMGPNAGDWGGYYCENHFPTGFQITDRLTGGNND
jgi:hypothetical protein